MRHYILAEEVTYHGYFRISEVLECGDEQSKDLLMDGTRSNADIIIAYARRLNEKGLPIKFVPYKKLPVYA